MSVLAQEPADVLSRYHFDPGHFTVSGFVVTEDHSALLLVLHERLGKWLQPGGHVEPDDVDFEAAIRREIAEETGLINLTRLGDGLFDIDVHEYPAARGEPHHEHHDLRYLFTALGEPAAGEGVADITWVPLRQLPDFAADYSVLRAATKLEGRGLGSGSEA